VCRRCPESTLPISLTLALGPWGALLEHLPKSDLEHSSRALAVRSSNRLINIRNPSSRLQAHIALHGKRSEREATHETTSLLPPQRKQASGERAQASGERRSARSVFASFRIPTSSIGEDDGVLKAKEAVAVCAFACLSCVRVMLLGISVSITRIKVCEAEGSSGRFRGVVKRCRTFLRSASHILHRPLVADASSYQPFVTSRDCALSVV